MVGNLCSQKAAPKWAESKDGTKAKVKIKVPVGTYSYTGVAATLPITSDVKWVRVSLIAGTTSGALLIDDLVLWVEPTVATVTRDAGGLLPPPAAPDGFRGIGTMP